jgi:hypothetical protein
MCHDRRSISDFSCAKRLFESEKKCSVAVSACEYKHSEGLQDKFFQHPICVIDMNTTNCGKEEKHLFTFPFSAFLLPFSTLTFRISIGL